MTITAADFLKWEAGARPGDVCVYARAVGALGEDVAVADTARNAFLRGQVELVQRRIGEKPAKASTVGTFEYVAIKRAATKPPRYPWRARHEAS